MMSETMQDKELWSVFMTGAMAGKDAHLASEQADWALVEYKRRWASSWEKRLREVAQESLDSYRADGEIDTAALARVLEGYYAD